MFKGLNFNRQPVKILQGRFHIWNRLCLRFLLSLFFIQPAFADFINGNFEDTYTPSSTNAYSPAITGWTSTGYKFNTNASATIPPTSINDIDLAAPSGSISLGGITNIIAGTTQTLFDYFLFGATPTPTLLLPIAGSQSAMINLRSIDAPLTKSGTGTATGFTAIGSQATSLSQTITVQSSDIDPIDGKVHIRFIASPVLENPSHPTYQQPFIAIQLNNLTTGASGSTPLFFQWNYGGQPGVPWSTLSSAGTNNGSDISYEYVIFQAFDISPGNAFIHVGDQIELVVLASGCSPGGHDGHLYLDDVGTSIPSGLLWVSATGPTSATPGDVITYTYTYINTGTAAVNNVQIIANLPLPATVSSPTSTTFVSVTTPTAGTSPSCSGTGPVTCSIGTLTPGQTGTFQLTVTIPSGWSTTDGPVNNGDYPISGTGLSTLLGPLVQTTLVLPSSLSNLVANANGLPTTATIGTPYSGTFSCSNTSTSTATGDSTTASCDITNLPTGLSEAGCTISPSSATWTEPTVIPAGQIVTCSVTGIPTVGGTVTATVATNATNNSNSTTNQVNATITVASSSSSPVIPASVYGSPILNPAIVCCGRPVLLGPLPVAGSGITTYTVIARTGNVSCFIGYSGTQAYLKMNGSNGSCTIVGSKNGTTSAPLTIVTP